jgi:hypothetical protein
VNPSGYEARLSQAQKSNKGNVGPHGFAKPCAPTMFLISLGAWESLASYPQGVHVIDDAKPLGI